MESSLQNIENLGAGVNEENKENSSFSKKKTKHRRKKSNSYHFGDNNSIEFPRNQNISPYFPNNNSNTNNIQHPYFNNPSAIMMETPKNLQNDEVLNNLLEKYKKARQKIQMQKNDHSQKLLQKMMKKQSELLNKLTEVRENNKKKKEQLYNEELRNKINYMESKLMFKKFEGDQMNFLLDLKNGSLFFNKKTLIL